MAEVAKITPRFFTAVFTAAVVGLALSSSVVGWFIGLAPLPICLLAWKRKRDDGVWLGLSTAVAVMPYVGLAMRLLSGPPTHVPL